MQRVYFKHISQQAFGVSWLDFAARLFATAVPLPRVSHFLILPQLCMTFLPNERQLNHCCFGLKNHMMLLDLDQRWILIFVLSVLHNICTCEHSFHSITCSWLFSRKTKITPTLSPVSVYYGAELRSAWETLIFFCICLSACLWCVCVCVSLSPQCNSVVTNVLLYRQPSGKNIPWCNSCLFLPLITWFSLSLFRWIFWISEFFFFLTWDSFFSVWFKMFSGQTQ